MDTREHEINEYVDSFESGYVMSRLEELDEPIGDFLSDDEHDEKVSLSHLRDTGRILCGATWDEGNVVLVRGSYFTEFVMLEASSPFEPAKWPYSHIDWDAAAAEKQREYSSLVWNGITYYAKEI